MILLNFLQWFLSLSGGSKTSPLSSYKLYLPVRTAPAKPLVPKINVHAQVQRHHSARFVCSRVSSAAYEQVRLQMFPAGVTYLVGFKNSSITRRVAHRRYQILGK